MPHRMKSWKKSRSAQSALLISVAALLLSLKSPSSELTFRSSDGELNEAFDWAKQRYYELMGWDPHSGEPTKECLQKLGLDELLA